MTVIHILHTFQVIITASATYGKNIKHKRKDARQYEHGPSQLLVLAPPIKHNEYYQEKYREVQQFYKRYSDAILAQQKHDNDPDRVVVVSDKWSYDDYVDAGVSENIMLMSHIDDPWVRDVAPPIPNSNVQFSFVGGSTLKEAQNTQSYYDAFLRRIGVQPYKTDLLLDGGNLVNNNRDKVITTRKFLTDNELTEKEGVEELKDLLQVDHVSIITQDEEKLGHSDGMAAYVCDNLIYQHKQEDPDFNYQVRQELLKGCPRCDIEEVQGFLDERLYKEGYASSCGVYVNCVVTNNYIYVPQFGGEHADLDRDALEQFKNNPCGKIAVPIDVSEVCIMGGSLRCLSWQTQGLMKDKVLQAVKNQDNHYRRKKELKAKHDSASPKSNKNGPSNNRKKEVLSKLDDILSDLNKLSKSLKN